MIQLPKREQTRQSKMFSGTFADWLLRLGQGTPPYVNLSDVDRAPIDLIKIPTELLVPSLDKLLTFVYGDNFQFVSDGSRAILCPTNDVVKTVNSNILNRLPGQAMLYVSIDEYQQGQGDDFDVPMDVINNIESTSLPPHVLHLKVGAVVMLLRNLDVTEGQCNGTRMLVTSLADNYIECKILCGTSKGKRTLIPKMKMTASDPFVPNPIVRFQLPVKLAFCGTINKAQGQTFNKVGIYLQSPCFTHGQLYVAFSRVGKCEDVRCFMECGTRQGGFRHKTKRRFTPNVVYCHV